MCIGACMCEGMCMCKYKCLWGPEEGIGATGAVVTGSCAVLNADAQNRTQVF